MKVIILILSLLSLSLALNDITRHNWKFNFGNNSEWCARYEWSNDEFICAAWGDTDVRSPLRDNKSNIVKEFVKNKIIVLVDVHKNKADEYQKHFQEQTTELFDIIEAKANFGNDRHCMIHSNHGLCEKCYEGYGLNDGECQSCVLGFRIVAPDLKVSNCAFRDYDMIYKGNEPELKNHHLFLPSPMEFFVNSDANRMIPSFGLQSLMVMDDINDRTLCTEKGKLILKQPFGDVLNADKNYKRELTFINGTCSWENELIIEGSLNEGCYSGPDADSCGKCHEGYVSQWRCDFSFNKAERNHPMCKPDGLSIRNKTISNIDEHVTRRCVKQLPEHIGVDLYDLDKNIIQCDYDKNYVMEIIKGSNNGDRKFEQIKCVKQKKNNLIENGLTDLLGGRILRRI